MTTPSLKGCWQKLARAEHHRANLRDEVRAFERTNAYNITVEVDVDAGKYEFYIQGLQPLKDHWGLIVGDCIHNARCALDHLVGQLVSLATKVDPGTLKATAFPIYSDPKCFKNAVASSLKDVPPGYKAVIRALQPFNASETTIWGVDETCTPSALPALLQQVANLDNIDKHRVVHTVWNRMKMDLALPALPPDFPPVMPARVVSPLENGAKIAEWQFLTPLPDPDWRPSDTELKRYFPINVCLENTFPGAPVYSDLAYYVAAVRAVLTIFDPVFSDGKLPLRPRDVMPLQPAEGP
jgi:hypothetical protein